jgi:integrase
MKINELREDNFIIFWLDRLNAAKNTERNYLIGMQFYTEWTGKTPKELILEAEAEIKAGYLEREKSIEKYFIGFRKQLQNKGLASMTVHSHMSGVISFYKSAGIMPPLLPKAGNRAQPLEKNKAIPSKEDLRAVLKGCDRLERAILLVGASSGLSCEEIINLKVGTFKTGYDPTTEITTLPLRRIKTKVDFVTFLTPEASRAVWDYLNYRERTVKTSEEKRQPVLDKQKVYSDNDFLFIGRHVSDSFLKTKNDNERRLREKGFSQIYRTLTEKAQKSTVKGTWNTI